jgi:hypothetical protein
MPFLGLVTGSCRAGHQPQGGERISAMEAKISIRVLTEAIPVLTEALAVRVWPKFVAADAGIQGIQVFESDDGRCVWMGPLRRT